MKDAKFLARLQYLVAIPRECLNLWKQRQSGGIPHRERHRNLVVACGLSAVG